MVIFETIYELDKTKSPLGIRSNACELVLRSGVILDARTQEKKLTILRILWSPQKRLIVAINDYQGDITDIPAETHPTTLAYWCGDPASSWMHGRKIEWWHPSVCLETSPRYLSLAEPPSVRLELPWMLVASSQLASCITVTVLTDAPIRRPDLIVLFL